MTECPLCHGDDDLITCADDDQQHCGDCSVRCNPCLTDGWEQLQFDYMEDLEFE